MNQTELKEWVLEIIGHIESGKRVEDSRVECKSSWPDPKRIARQLAGHANAALGDKILWLIGIDEDAGLVCGAPNKELANWYPQVKKYYDGGAAPRLHTDLNITHENLVVVALLFQTGNAPFLVKSLKSDRLEIPWREGTRTRSAVRSEVLKIFSSLQFQGQIPFLPGFENESPRARMLSLERPPYWEYLLTVELLNSKLAPVLRKYEDVETGLVTGRTRPITKSKVLDWLKAKNHDLRRMVQLIPTTMKEEIPKSWGKSGEEGNPLEIKRAVEKLASVCDQLVEWDGELQRVLLPEECDNLISLMKGTPSELINSVREYADDITRVFSNPDPNEEYSINIKLTFGESQYLEITNELERLTDTGFFTRLS